MLLLWSTTRTQQYMSAQKLWPLLNRALLKIDYENAGMIPSRTPSGRGFFPSCEGVWNLPHNPSVSHRKLLFLGQDFGTEEALPPSGETATVPTWRHLQDLMTTAGIDAQKCFFTNAVMGNRKPGTPNTGLAAAFESDAFINKCADFLRVQLEVVQPAGIVVLGLQVLKVLRIAGTGIPQAETLREWDRTTKRSLITVQVGAWEGQLALLVHPSFRPTNIRHRALATTGSAAEGKAHELSLLSAIM